VQTATKQQAQLTAAHCFDPGSVYTGWGLHSYLGELPGPGSEVVGWDNALVRVPNYRAAGSVYWGPPGSTQYKKIAGYVKTSLMRLGDVSNVCTSGAQTGVHCQLKIVGREMKVDLEMEPNEWVTVHGAYVARTTSLGKVAVGTGDSGGPVVYKKS